MDVRTDCSYGLRFVLDLPLPQQLDCRPWCCFTCGARFTPTLHDIKAACPEMLHCGSERYGQALLTRQYLVHVIEKFFELLNARGVRRSLVEYFTANSLALAGGARGLWFASAVPRPPLSRKLICIALEQYLPPLVQHMAAHTHVYSGSAVKGDGHEGLATRIVECRLDPITGRQSLPVPSVSSSHGMESMELC